MPVEAFPTLEAAEPVLFWTDQPSANVPSVGKEVGRLWGACDPWYVLDNARRIIVDGDDELVLIAAINGIPVACVAPGRYSSVTSREAAAAYLSDQTYVNPYSGAPMNVMEAAALCGFWRKLIDSNREITSAFGFAFWKQPTVAPLLWAGEDPVPFKTALSSADSDGEIAVWKSRTPTDVLARIEREADAVLEVEDGFIRSVGLGSDCVPPLSIVVDRLGVHFDPAKPSELENLLQNGAFDSGTLQRARDLRELIVEVGVSKYGSGSAKLEAREPNRHYVLVPGQVEDDRAVLCGAQAVAGNLDLLRRVREQRPDACIIYKPHPDVEAGHRIGAVEDREALALADEIVRDQPISALIDYVDELHVNTSLAGFEALLRKKPVTAHGVPFYAGWGLTTDLGPVPARRSAKRSLDELVAAVLLTYPRYLDPVTGLPCPPEILIRRIAEGAAGRQSHGVVKLRRLQGRWKKRLAGIKA
ncbi:hypothetical protein H9L15_11930 [Sphingomonas daechungensis]|uniref:Capsular biosynthesis protein n=1 Tax=Sphingomonas daechungensis TaxID=1176646 RepID=A0ABX6SZQ1_9SPHN|nr:hypothetical protein [Sphingomonas daechungensis]QNP42789.1 hypothetical protein H9L15_11930 [Sphingomonas daechungensis]